MEQALEKLIDDRVMAKLKELKLLDAVVSATVLVKPDSLEEKFYPTMAVSEIDLYTRDVLDRAKDRGKHVEKSWDELGWGLQADYVERANIINDNYLCLEPPAELKPADIKVPSLENAMERLFFDQGIRYACREHSRISAQPTLFAAKARQFKREWAALDPAMKETYRRGAEQLIANWKTAAAVKPDPPSDQDCHTKAVSEIGPDMQDLLELINTKQTHELNVAAEEEKRLQGNAIAIFKDHYLRQPPKSILKKLPNQLLWEAEDKWEKLSAEAKQPYLTMGAESVALYKKRYAYFASHQISQ